MPIFIGGLMRFIVERMSGEKEESEISSGMLYSTGLVAGGSIGGVLIASLSIPFTKADGTETSLLNMTQFGLHVPFLHKLLHEGARADLIAVACFGVLCWILVRAACRKIEGIGA
jgi:hypothetical protein